MEKSNVKNLRVWSDLKKAAIVFGALFTGVTASACDNVKQNEDVAVAPTGYSSTADSNSKNTEERVTTTYKIDTTDSVDNYVVDSDESIDNVEVSDVEPEVTKLSTTVTGEIVTTKPLVIVHENPVPNQYTSATEKVKSTTKTTAKTNSSVNSNTTAKPITTKITTKLTTKPTTKATTTTTTTEPPIIETQPPATEPELPPVEGRFTIGGATIEDAMMYSIPFNRFKNSFRGELMRSDSGLLHIPMPYGENGEMIDTFGGDECTWIFVALNWNYVYECFYADFGGDDIDCSASDFKTFICNFGHVQSITGNDIDFTRYTYNVEVGEFLNGAQTAFRGGYIESFLGENLNSMSDECKNNPGVMGILCGYDTNHSYLNKDDVSENYLNGFINHVYESSCGYSYSNCK